VESVSTDDDASPKRKGRPPTGKRGTFTFRVTDQLRSKLEEAAAAVHRPVSEEIERRLEQSFSIPDLVDGVIQGTLKGLFGRDKILEICQQLAISLKEVERISGEKLEEDYLTNWESYQAYVQLGEILFRVKEPPDEDLYEERGLMPGYGRGVGLVMARPSKLPKASATRPGSKSRED
jgi:hypothetical protein